MTKTVHVDFCAPHCVHCKRVNLLYHLFLDNESDIVYVQEPPFTYGYSCALMFEGKMPLRWVVMACAAILKTRSYVLNVGNKNGLFRYCECSIDSVVQSCFAARFIINSSWSKKSSESSPSKNNPETYFFFALFSSVSWPNCILKVADSKCKSLTIRACKSELVWKNLIVL